MIITENGHTQIGAMQEIGANERQSLNGIEIQSHRSGRIITGALVEDLKTLILMDDSIKRRLPMSEPMSDSLVLNDVDDFAYRIWKAIETKKDDAARRRIAEREAQLIASTLQAAADRAQAFYKSDCGGCGEWCDEPPRCNREEESEHCHHIRSLRKAILAPLNKE